MGSREFERMFSAVVGGVLAVAAVGAFAFLFLATGPVEAVRHLYLSFHLDAVMTLDDLFGIGHLLTYAVITALLACRTPSAPGWLGLFVALALIGFGVECAQEIVGGRQFNLDDVLANICGITLGFLCVIAAGPRVVRRA